MNSTSVDKLQVFPILTAVSAIAIVGAAIKLYISWNKGGSRKKPLILLTDPVKKYSLPLIKKDVISHDTRKFRFGLPSSDHVLGLPIGQHVHLTAKIGDDVVIRSYTPVSSDDDYGYVDLVIKVYFKNVHPKFPEGGKLSQYLENMKMGDTIDFRGPSGRLVYKGHGQFSIKVLRKDPPTEYNVKKVVMLAGGTGITPMLQLMRAMVKDPTDKTQVSLLFANRTEKDILLRDELDQLTTEYPDKFKIWYTLDTCDDDWPYSKGFMNADMVTSHMFPPSSDTIVLMCGPDPMIKFTCNPILDKLGYDAKLRFAY